MIELSEEAKRLTSTFLAYRNDIDIFTEDEEKDKEFYKVLFKRLVKNDIIINDITPLGNKDAVLRRCHNEPENGRKKIFIVDGDVSIIHGNGIPVMKNLFVLNAYCIENFLFDRDTMIHFIYLNCATKPREVIEKEVDFENWLEQYSEFFIELFIHFSLADYFGKYYTLYNANKYHIATKETFTFCPDLVSQDIESIKSSILETTSESDYLTKYTELKQKWATSLNSLFTIVSGKDYLIPILLIKTQCFKKSNALPSLEELKLSLIQFSNLDRLQELKSRIEAL
ncbi:DUF4435 domain-containing protein [Terrimonas ferruginea]|uniref:DUF4435 domain-containing protein n=1 Tax=Terrimonas ferruginea TaxID=249 RepID=UPI00041FDEDF|nr:DUF4435 domain-containing protein [Terrimonas ferruginea]